jgi:hypothetical protein
MTEEQYCQSCGMPMQDENLYGTQKDGSKTSEYCSYCYERGSFKQPDVTMGQMIELCVPYMKESGMAEEEARGLLNRVLPEFKRWKA